MAFRLPDRDELVGLAADFSQELDPAGAAALLAAMAPFRAGYEYLDALPDELPPVRYGERSFRAPAPADDPLGAWAVLTDIHGQAGGVLAGRRVAVKDSILVAGVPLADGTDLLGDYRPEFDATVVSRLLDAGATIAGKAQCEYLCLSGGSTTAAGGFVRNPRNPAFSAGGSSSGSAALVAAGTVDLALGTDQAGSVRIPASWCGCVGLKPTYGLVPFTGIIGMSAICDHVGPMTATVCDNALMLEVLAGADGLDGRQGTPTVHAYTRGLQRGVAGLRVGVLREAIAAPPCTAAVVGAVSAAAAQFARLGARVCEVSVPLHPPGIAIWSGVLIEPLGQALRSGGALFNLAGIDSPGLARALRGWTTRAARLPVNVLMTLVIARYLERYAGEFYVKAHNFVPRLRRAYDDVLADCDLLLLPTTPGQASRLPDPPSALTTAHVLADLFGTSVNTCQFNVTGHPALSMPCGMHDGLPVGMMLVGRHFEEQVLYGAAHAFEQAGGATRGT